MFSFIKADELLIHKRIIPISLLQNTHILEKKDKIINFIIAVDNDQILKALEFKKILPKKIKNYKLNIIVLKEKDIKKYCQTHNNIDAIYMFDLSNDIWSYIKKFTIKHNITVYCYKKDGLKKGGLFYIEFTDKIHILVNKKVLKQSNMIFNSQFLQILEVYDKI